MICVGGACIQNKAHNISITSKTLSILFQKDPGCPLVTGNHWIVSDNLAYLPAYNAHLKFWIHCEKKKTKRKKKKLQAIERKTLSVHPLVLLSVFTFTNVKE